MSRIVNVCTLKIRGGVSNEIVMASKPERDLESNQNHATITDNGICPTLPASMGMGGGYVPMVVMGCDFQNCVQTGNKAMTLTGGRVDGHSVPCVMISNETDNTNREEVLRMARGRCVCDLEK